MCCTVMFTVLKASLLSLLHSKSPICFPQVTSHKKRLLETPRQFCHSQVMSWHRTIYLYHPPVWKAGAALFNMKKKKQGESCSSDLWIHQELTSWNLNKCIQAGTGCNSFRQTKRIRQQEALKKKNPKFIWSKNLVSVGKINAIISYCRHRAAEVQRGKGAPREDSDGTRDNKPFCKDNVLISFPWLR